MIKFFRNCIFWLSSRTNTYLFIGACVVTLIGFLYPQFLSTLVPLLYNEAGIASLISAIFFLILFHSNRDKLTAVLLVIASLLSQSPLVPFFTGLTGNYFFAFFIFLLLILTLSRSRVRSRLYILFILIYIGSLFSVIYWNSPKLFVLPLYYISAMLVAYSLTRLELYLFTAFSSKLILFLLIGAVIASLYTAAGGFELFSLQNEDGRSNGFYLSSLSNSYAYGTIRPSGIYDEPGALSLITCIIAAIREKLILPQRLTIVILMLGLITLNVAHLIFLFIYFVFVFKINKKSKNFLIAILAVLAIAISFTPIGGIVSFQLINRLQIVDGRLVADNRSSLVLNSINYLKTPEVLFFGLDSSCVTSANLCNSKGYAQFGDNFLAPLVLYGVFQSISYYFCILAILIYTIRFRSGLDLGIILILLFRNEVMSYGYSLILAIYFSLVFPGFVIFTKNHFSSLAAKISLANK